MILVSEQCREAKVRKKVCMHLSIACSVVIFNFLFWGDLEVVSHLEILCTKILTLRNLRNFEGVNLRVCLGNWSIMYPVPLMASLPLKWLK